MAPVCSMKTPWTRSIPEACQDAIVEKELMDFVAPPQVPRSCLWGRSGFDL